MNGLFRDQAEEGVVLAPKLREFERRTDATVLALPRVGMNAGCEVPCKLHLPSYASP